MEKNLGPEKYLYSCAVYETGSDQCATLPANFFDGLKDSRSKMVNRCVVRVTK